MTPCTRNENVGRGEQTGFPVGTRAIAARTKVTVETLIDDSEKVLQRAMEVNQLGAANTAIKGKAILSGNWVEHVEVGGPGEFDAMSDEELERALIERVQKLGLLERVQKLGFYGKVAQNVAAGVVGLVVWPV
jgi:hypothetical protein